ncbi:hypothetical protein DYB28_014628 [Aphanomyces astaci]|uniref:Uncharacterized protein n=1 Tax=Aphanomyces astaci TaxID=112090 RepID=A0A9X8DR52_APHAT|nr:hypothetical protein DYB28_014628 [Aphanomyces astaci]
MGCGIRALVKVEAVAEHTSVLVYHDHGDVTKEEVSKTWSCPYLDGTLEGIAEELLAMFHEAATEGEAVAFLTDVINLAPVVKYAKGFLRWL